MPEQRYRAVLEVISEGRTVGEVAAQWAVSRQTLHAWLVRYEAEGLEGLADRSHRPAGCPHQMPAATEAAVLEMRREHPYWGLRGPGVRKEAPLWHPQIRQTASLLPASPPLLPGPTPSTRQNGLHLRVLRYSTGSRSSPTPTAACSRQSGHAGPNTTTRPIRTTAMRQSTRAPFTFTTGHPGRRPWVPAEPRPGRALQ